MRFVPASQMQGRRLCCQVMRLAVISIGLFWLAGCSASHPRWHIEVTRCESHDLLLRLESLPGSDFSIWFFHSYDRAYFEEHYRTQLDGRILLTHMSFQSNLNGQGFVLGTYRSKGDGSAELADINQELEEVVFRLGSPDLADHSLIAQGRRVRLLDYAEPGALICIRLQSEPSSAPLRSR